VTTDIRVCHSGTVEIIVQCGEERTVNLFVAHFSLAVLAQPLPWNPSVSSFLSFDESFNFTLDDGCHYDAHISGILKPVLYGRDAGNKVEPDFDISANLFCPQMPKQHIDERLSNTGPLTRERVEDLISRQATMTSEAPQRRCTYVPRIRFMGEGIVGIGVDATCTRPRL
jgi:hypothetical protein